MLSTFSITRFDYYHLIITIWLSPSWNQLNFWRRFKKLGISLIEQIKMTEWELNWASCRLNSSLNSSTPFHVCLIHPTTKKKLIDMCNYVVFDNQNQIIIFYWTEKWNIIMIQEVLDRTQASLFLVKPLWSSVVPMFIFSNIKLLNNLVGHASLFLSSCL